MRVNIHANRRNKAQLDEKNKQFAEKAEFLVAI